MKTLTLKMIVSALVLGPLVHAKNAPTKCTIKAYDGHFLTAVGGGGRTSDVIHSDAKKAQAWEIFTLVDSDKGTPNITYGIQTSKGFFLTAVSGGGRTTDVIHSDARNIRDWEEFQLESLGNDWYAIKTYNGNYLTAQDSGGRITDVIHSDARRIGNWEKFKVKCGL